MQTSVRANVHMKMRFISYERVDKTRSQKEVNGLRKLSLSYQPNENNILAMV